MCPQLKENPYEEPNNPNSFAGTAQTSEDCLYVNVWAPETGFRSNGNLPVLVVITGEEMAFDWTTNRPTGLDLAAEGIVVVDIQYRTNIFGWLSLAGSGNFGLLDQIAAIDWVQKNVHKFGGNAQKITILGHGTTGSANAMIHLLSNKSGNFSSAILMSGTIFSSYSLQLDSELHNGPSRKIITNLACDAAEDRFILACLRRKSVDDLLRAFQNIYQVGNYSHLLGPVIDNNVIQGDVRARYQAGEYKRIPTIVGITNQEGAYLRDNWVAFSKQGAKALQKFIDDTIIPNVLDHNFYQHGQTLIKDAIEWKYFDKETTVPYLMNGLQRLVSETHFEVPFFDTIEILSRTRLKVLNGSSAEREANYDNLFVYSYQQSTPIDMRGRTNYFGGSHHSSDLPYLMGPSLFQQISRRRLSQTEDKMSKMFKEYFANFIKFGLVI